LELDQESDQGALMLTRAKYKRIPDLYVQGTEHRLRDGTPLWLQVLNPFEADEARHDAQVARSRLMMALREVGSDEFDLLRGNFLRYGRDGVVNLLAEHASNTAMMEAVNDIKQDPDWRERVEIMERSEEILAKPAEEPERELLSKINQEWLTELGDRAKAAHELEEELLQPLSDDELWERYREHYIETRGNEVGVAEHQLTKVWYATRVCEGEEAEGQWDHSACEGHELRVWDTKAEVRGLPEDLLNELSNALDEVDMSVGEAKNSDRQGSSSGSSPLPSEGEGSTASTPDETPDKLPGSSPTPSATP
jgi:hypothetical protein